MSNLGETTGPMLKAWTADVLPRDAFWTVRRVSKDLVRASVAKGGMSADAVGETFVQAISSAFGKLSRGEGKVMQAERKKASP